MEDSQTEFSKKVIKLIQAVPKGRVATYGLIAQMAGNPRGARAVGWLLHSSTQKRKLPWQRIIKAGGLLSFPDPSTHFSRQKALLKAEGVDVKNGKVDLEKYLWRPRFR